MDVYLVRHAIAAQRSPADWPDDSKRPLTAKGEALFRSAARGLSTVAPVVDRVLSSPYVRAWQTAEALHEEAGWPEPETCSVLEADRSPEDVLDVLDELKSIGAVALVGHEPFLSALASRLLCGERGVGRLELKKGGVVLLELHDRAVLGAGRMRWSLPPKILRALDPKRD